jgi:hypothetical protein
VCNYYYIREIKCSNRTVSLTIYGITQSDTHIYIGSATAFISKDYQIVNVTSDTTSFASGFIIIGSQNVFSENFDIVLNENTGALEQTCFMYINRPAVSSLKVRPTSVNVGFGESLTGKIKTSLIGLNADYNTINTLKVNAKNPRSTMPKTNRSLCAGDCDSPIIYDINSVSPSPIGNIDVVAIPPLYIESVSPGVLSVTTTVTRDELCQASRKLEAPDIKDNNYYTDVVNAVKEEWRTWPQYT